MASLGAEGNEPRTVACAETEADEAGAPEVLAVDHGHAHLAGREQLRLGAEIGLHGVVVVQVVLAQVGENAGGELGAV